MLSMPPATMMSQVLVPTACSLLSLSVQGVTQHEEIVAELKRMLAGYLLLEESVAAGS